MQAWQLDRLGGSLQYRDLPVPQARPGAVVVRMEASSLMSYMKDYVEGKLAIYHAPNQPFIPGGNGTGIVHAVGTGVLHIQPGQRVMISSHVVAQENVTRPAQILLGITANGPDAERLQTDWPDGTLADYAVLPAGAVTSAEGLTAVDAVELAVAMRFIVPYGGLLRGRLAPGETIVVSGATGAYGTAAVLLALSMGAGRVVALGRNAASVEPLQKMGQGRVVPCVVSGDVSSDSAALRDATEGGADVAFDMVGNARDPNMTLSALRSLVPGGRLVLMGSMNVPLPIPYLDAMLNGWEILGQFMYPRDAYRRLLDLVRSGLLDLRAIRALPFTLERLPDAMDAAAHASPFECVVMDHRGDHRRDDAGGGRSCSGQSCGT